jgi:hypothetical protein
MVSRTKTKRGYVAKKKMSVNPAAKLMTAPARPSQLFVEAMKDGRYYIRKYRDAMDELARR